MKKIILAASISLLSCNSFAQDNVNQPIQSLINAECKVGGCKYICTDNTGKEYTKSSEIKRATIYTLESGAVNAFLERAFDSTLVVTPPATESCKLINIDKFVK